MKSCSPAALDPYHSFVFWKNSRGAWCGKISETYCLSTFSTLLVGPKIQDTFSEQLSGQGTETENGKPGARDTYLTGRITEEISVQERTPREALPGYLCAERKVRIGECVAIQRQSAHLYLSAFSPIQVGRKGSFFLSLEASSHSYGRKPIDS